MASIVYEAKQLADRLRKEMEDRAYGGGEWPLVRWRVAAGAVASGRWCGGEWPQCGLSGHHESAH